MIPIEAAVAYLKTKDQNQIITIGQMITLLIALNNVKRYEADERLKEIKKHSHILDRVV